MKKGFTMKNVMTLVVALVTILTSSTAEARWWRRSRSVSVTRVSAVFEFTGDAQAVCEQKAAIMASRCFMAHLGGSFGGGSCEGVGCSTSSEHALSICCYSNSGRTIIGQAVVRGANGMFYACRIFR